MLNNESVTLFYDFGPPPPPPNKETQKIVQVA